MDNDTTPPLHPVERDQLQAESTLVVTVKSGDEFREDVTAALEGLADDEAVDATPTLSFTSYDALMEALTPRALELIEAVRRDEPASINGAARVVDRDVKNVHEELHRLARRGIIYFEEDGRSKRPVVWFDELQITLPFPRDGATGTASSAP